MLIGQRLRDIRIARSLTQDDIASRTGFARTYVSSVENGHMTPSVPTLEKWAQALRMPLYQILHDGEKPPKPVKDSNKGKQTWGSSSKREAQQLYRLRRYLVKMNESERSILFVIAHWMASNARRK